MNTEINVVEPLCIGLTFCEYCSNTLMLRQEHAC